MAVARRCLGCQNLFEPARSDARTCSGKCRQDVYRRGGEQAIRATLNRPAGWWDDVRTWPAMMNPAGATLDTSSIVIPFEPGQLVLTAIDDKGTLGVQVIVLASPRSGVA
jgi:hypothetical protein